MKGNTFLLFSLRAKEEKRIVRPMEIELIRAGVTRVTRMNFYQARRSAIFIPAVLDQQGIRARICRKHLPGCHLLFAVRWQTSMHLVDRYSPPSTWISRKRCIDFYKRDIPGCSRYSSELLNGSDLE